MIPEPSIWRRLRSSVGRRLPRVSAAYRVLLNGMPPAPPAVAKPTFDGWGMKTHTTTPPWEKAGQHPLAGMPGGFLKSHLEFQRRIVSGDLVLSQLSGRTDIPEAIDRLRWRHFTLYSSVQLAETMSRGHRKVPGGMVLAECGVCDGMGAFFALESAIHAGVDPRYLGYDAWQAMPADRLLTSEQRYVNAYDYLQLDWACFDKTDREIEVYVSCF